VSSHRPVQPHAGAIVALGCAGRAHGLGGTVRGRRAAVALGRALRQRTRPSAICFSLTVAQRCGNSGGQRSLLARGQVSAQKPRLGHHEKLAGHVSAEQQLPLGHSDALAVLLCATSQQQRPLQNPPWRWRSRSGARSARLRTCRTTWRRSGQDSGSCAAGWLGPGRTTIGGSASAYFRARLVCSPHVAGRINRVYCRQRMSVPWAGSTAARSHRVAGGLLAVREGHAAGQDLHAAPRVRLRQQPPCVRCVLADLAVKFPSHAEM
jgi:hypothetical protein